MAKIVIIEDEDLIRENLKRFFEEKDYETYVADSGTSGIQLVKDILPHIVFLDIGLPDMSGMEVLQIIRNFDRTIKVIIVSAMTADEVIEEAMEKGASDYVKKPFSVDYLEGSVLKKVSTQIIEHQRDTIIQVVYALANTLEAKSKYTRGHSESVAKYTEWIAEEMQGMEGWEWIADKIGFFRNVALLHDIGKMSIADKILDKPGKLTEQEREYMKKHPVIGANIVGTIDDLSHYSDGILYHHEYWDGRGYNDGLTGDEIPIEARILAVADAFDAMISDRPYREAMTEEEALDQIIKAKGAQFDPVVVEALIKAIEKRNNSILAEEMN